ncbi:hypothetical protein PISMIDRAFT_681172, partial [Pisolithus microcarpus 441]
MVLETRGGDLETNFKLQGLRAYVYPRIDNGLTAGCMETQDILLGSSHTVLLTDQKTRD